MLFFSEISANFRSNTIMNIADLLELRSDLAHGTCAVK